MYVATSKRDADSMLGCASQRLNISLHSAAHCTNFKALVKGVSGFQHVHKSSTLNDTRSLGQRAHNLIMSL